MCLIRWNTRKRVASLSLSLHLPHNQITLQISSLNKGMDSLFNSMTSISMGEIILMTTEYHSVVGNDCHRWYNGPSEIKWMRRERLVSARLHYSICNQHHYSTRHIHIPSSNEQEGEHREEKERGTIDLLSFHSHSDRSMPLRQRDERERESKGEREK